MSFINERFRRLVDAHHRKSAGKRHMMMGGGVAGMHQNGGDPHHDGDSNSSTYAEASIRSDPNVYASYTSETKLPFSAFQSLRKSEATGAHSSEISLTEAQETSVMRALKRVADGGGGSVEDSLPFVSALLDKHCPALSQYLPSQVTRTGATFLMLSVITGHKKLAEACLQLRSQPNSAAFLSWPASSNPEEEAQSTRHGFSPLFMAVICQRLEIAELLYENGAYVMTTDRWGRTPLHAAYTLEDDEMVSWLLGKRAMQTSFDRDRMRPGEDKYDTFPPPQARPRVIRLKPKVDATAKKPQQQANGGSKDGGASTDASADTTTDLSNAPMVCSVTENETCHCQDCVEDRLRIERSISNWLSPEYIDILALAADLEREQREAKVLQQVSQQTAQLHQQQLAEALNTAVKQEQQRQAQAAAAAVLSQGGSEQTVPTSGEEQTPSPAAVVGEEGS